MPDALDWILLAVIVVGLGARAWLGMRALRALGPDADPARRHRMWARAIGSQWLLAVLLVAGWLWRHRSFASLGLRAPAPWGLGGVLFGVALVAAILAGQRRQVAAQPRLRERVRARLAPVAALMPRTAAERPGFVSLAITAGVCEELLFRGFACWLLACVLPAFWLAVVVQAVLFGLAHAYQGPRGVLTTGVVGLFMAGLVFVSGSLWAAMLVHALMDIHAGEMAVQVLGPPGTAADA